MVTATANGIPGDPINVGLVGGSRDILCAMREAWWYAADPVTWKSSLEISGSVLLDRPYPRAPVSPLFMQADPRTWRLKSRSDRAPIGAIMSGSGLC